MDEGTAQPNCIFCSIIAKNEENILYRDEHVIIINDIKPASKHHFLVISLKHIVDAKCLTKDDKPLVETMIEKAKMMLEKNNLDVSDTRFAFHWPPFHSVPHLHLHAISPLSGMSFFSKLIFKPNTWWCVSNLETFSFVKHVSWSGSIPAVATLFIFLLTLMVYFIRSFISNQSNEFEAPEYVMERISK